MIAGIFYECLFLIPFSLTVSFLVRDLTGGSGAEPLCILIGLFSLTVFMLYKHLKTRGRTVVSGVLLAVILSVIMILPSGERLDILKANVFILREILTAAGCFIAVQLFFRFRALRFIIAASGITALILSLPFGARAGRLVSCLTVLFFFLTLADEIQRFSDKSGDSDPKKHLVGISPFILAVFFLTLILKIPDRPYDWGFVKSASEFLESRYIYICENLFGSNGWDSSSPFIGFSDRAAPGGDLKRSDIRVMDITPYSECDPVIYLAGKSFDSFDGHSWQKRDDSPIDEGLMDTMETLSALQDQKSDDNKGDLYLKSSFSVKYRDMYAGCLFLPPKYFNLAGGPDRIRYQGGDLLFTDKRGNRSPYTVNYFRINRDSADFKDFIDLHRSPDKEKWESAAAIMGNNELPGFDDYISYRDMVYKNYLPETRISDKTRQFVSELISGTGSDYEKLCVLEGMFRNLRYTDSPGSIPDTVKSESDFLDYFLWDKKEGYCSYYASAFVILSRAYGIPARYVQGYKLDSRDRRLKIVSSSDAHAWAEAYIDGAGWFIFEPTPGMRRSVSWDAAYGREPYIPENAGNMQDSLSSDGSVEEKEQDSRGVLNWFRWERLIIPILCGVLVILLTLSIDQIVKKRYYNGLDERGKSEYICRRIMELLKKKRLKKREDETLSEYGKRLRELIPGHDFLFIGIYEEILYSDREITKEDRLALEREYLLIRRQRKAEAEGVTPERTE